MYITSANYFCALIVSLIDKIKQLKEHVAKVEKETKTVEKDIQGIDNSKSEKRYEEQFERLLDEEETTIDDIEYVEEEFIQLINYETEELLEYARKLVKWEKDAYQLLTDIEHHEDLLKIQKEMKKLESERRQLENDIPEDRFHETMEFILEVPETLKIFEELQNVVQQSMVEQTQIEKLGPKMHSSKHQKHIKKEHKEINQVENNLENLDKHIRKIKEIEQLQEEVEQKMLELDSVKEHIEKLESQMDTSDPQVEHTLQLLYNLDQQLHGQNTQSTSNSRDLQMSRRQVIKTVGALATVGSSGKYLYNKTTEPSTEESSSQQPQVLERGSKEQNGVAFQYRVFKEASSSNSDIRIDYIITNQNTSTLHYELLTEISTNLGVSDTKNIDEGSGGIYKTERRIEGENEQMVSLKLDKIQEGSPSIRNKFISDNLKTEIETKMDKDLSNAKVKEI